MGERRGITQAQRLTDLYETLGVPKNAMPDAIKAAYRKKAQKAHPDKSGNEQQFHAIQKAYEVLSDAGRRAQYDANGQTETPDTEAQALGYVAQTLHILLDTADIAHADLVFHMLERCRMDLAQIAQEVAKTKSQQDRRRNALERLTGDRLRAIVEGEIGQLEQALVMLNGKTEIVKRAQEIVKGHAYRVDQMPMYTQVYTTQI